MRKGRHSTFLLRYQLVFVVKDRQPVITKEIGEYLFTETKRLLKLWEGNLIEGNYEKDHIHLLIDMSPKYELSKYIGTLKHRLAKLVKEKYSDEISKYLWNNAFWTESYYIASVGETNLATIQEYIEKQGTKRTYNKKKSSYWQKVKKKNGLSSPT